VIGYRLQYCLNHYSFWIIILPVFFAAQTYSQEEKQEVYYSFQYEGIVNSVITARLENYALYLPVGELFSALHINHTIDIQKKEVHGFFVRTDNRYTLDFDTLAAFIGKRTYRLQRKDGFVSESDIFLSPAIFDSVFQLHFVSDTRQLSLTLTTIDILPVVEEQQRIKGRRLGRGTALMQEFHPLLYPRERTLLNGGVVDYSLTASRAGQKTDFTYDVLSGLEIFGGDFQLGRTGYICRSRDFFQQFNDKMALCV